MKKKKSLNQGVIRIKKVLSCLFLFCLCSCADFQDAMPGMSYSDRTLSKGIRECADLILKQSFSDLGNGEDQYAIIISKQVEKSNLAFVKTLQRLDRYNELETIYQNVNKEVNRFFVERYLQFADYAQQCKLPREPEYLMNSGLDRISHYYSNQINWKSKIKLILESDASFNKLEAEINTLSNLYNDIPYLDEKVEFDLADIVSSLMASHLLEQMAYHELELRRNPNMRITPILEKTFGDYDPV